MATLRGGVTIESIAEKTHPDVPSPINNSMV